MSQTSHIQQLQSPAWKPVYGQKLIMTEDLMVINIQEPSESTLEKQLEGRSGLVDQKNFNYFDKKQEYLEEKKKRYPFFY
ncbi:MAG: hypothetical protein DRO88_13025 [Promethearchaeia archaeon]|nr:MAG: hypothetical protein DRO88_13025 [Candidatus Lokiarchaeia archaeon]